MTRTHRLGLLPALGLFALAACAGGAANNVGGGGSDATSTKSTQGYTVPQGTAVEAAITDTITTRRSKAGDSFTANVVADVRSGGRVVIPAGSTVHGTVTDVKEAPNRNTPGTLTIAVTSLTVRGDSYPISASIDSLDTVRKARGVEPVDAARVGGGAAAGAILGRVIGGDSKGTIIGAAVGGAAGAVVSNEMKDVDVILPAGSHMYFSLSKAVAIK
jgi:Glycine zipper